jgi:hypothetical protein
LAGGRARLLIKVKARDLPTTPDCRRGLAGAQRCAARTLVV